MGSHRAVRRGSGRSASATPLTGKRAAAPAGGRRRSTEHTGSSHTGSGHTGPRHTGSRGPLFRILPSAPVLAGVAVLAVAVGGAVTSGVGGDRIEGVAKTASATLVQPGALTGSSKVAKASLLDDRTVSVSRGGNGRETTTGTADSKLVQQAEDQAEARTKALQQFAAKAEKQSARIKANLWVLPVAGYHLSAGFGETSYLWSSVHTGLDFAAPSGTPIVAVARGVVTEVGYDGAYGNKTVITLDDGTELWFCHQTSYAVSVGESVTPGQVIGYVGSTGNTTGPHLHLEVRPGAGDPVDPYAALVAHGVTP